MPREDDRVAIFRMDKDQFRRQIAELEQAGAEYEGAKASLSSAVGNSCQDLQNTGACTPSDDDRWSGLNELQQFRAPVHTSLFAVDKEMKQLSELQKATIEDLRSSLDSFTYRDDAERAEFAAALDRLDRASSRTPRLKAWGRSRRLCGGGFARFPYPREASRLPNLREGSRRFLKRLRPDCPALAWGRLNRGLGTPDPRKARRAREAVSDGNP